MATSKTIIGNLALQLLGEPQVSSFTDGSEAAKLLNLRWETSRDAVLREHAWNFAIARKVLTPLAAAPAFGPTKQYQLPVDCLYPLSISQNYDNEYIKYGASEPFQIEGGKLLTDNTEVYLTYIRREDVTSLYDPMFVEALSAKLAMELAFSLTGSNTLVANITAIYTDTLKRARARDARESSYRKQLSDPDRVRYD